MKIQGTLIFALIFAFITAFLAIVNVTTVPVDYIFGKADIPLILVILSSTLLGGLIVGSFGIIRQFSLQRKIRSLQHELDEMKKKQLETQYEQKILAAAAAQEPTPANE